MTTTATTVDDGTTITTTTTALTLPDGNDDDSNPSLARQRPLQISASPDDDGDEGHPVIAASFAEDELISTCSHLVNEVTFRCKTGKPSAFFRVYKVSCS